MCVSAAINRATRHPATPAFTADHISSANQSAAGSSSSGLPALDGRMQHREGAIHLPPQKPFDGTASWHRRHCIAWRATPFAVLLLPYRL
jgi:hypothetical protein